MSSCRCHDVQGSSARVQWASWAVSCGGHSGHSCAGQQAYAERLVPELLLMGPKQLLEVQVQEGLLRQRVALGRGKTVNRRAAEAGGRLLAAGISRGWRVLTEQ